MWNSLKFSVKEIHASLTKANTLVSEYKLMNFSIYLEFRRVLYYAQSTHVYRQAHFA